MAVMFSIGEGKIVAENIINGILNKPFVVYKPLDLGYLIPMAEGKAPGEILGMKIHGVLGYILHYCMCVYRTEWEKKAGVIKDLVFRK